MPDFRVAFTGEFLDESGAVAYGDIGLDRLASRPSVRWHFIVRKGRWDQQAAVVGSEIQGRTLGVVRRCSMVRR